MQKDVTQLLQRWMEGDSSALERLIPVVYDELRRIADYLLKAERKNHTLQTTALVHEAYLRLADQSKMDWKNRAQFFGVASQLMRRVLVDHARKHLAAKRGGGAVRVTLTDVSAESGQTQDIDLIALDEALSRLEKITPRGCRIVELRFFSGLTAEETAEVLEVSVSTVQRDWNFARAWLYRELQGESAPPSSESPECDSR